MRLHPMQAAMLAAMTFLLLPLLLPVSALAQEAAIPIVATEPPFLQQLVLALVPIIGLVVSTLLTIGVAILKQKTGIDIEARHRDALQSALLNGILFAIQRAGWVPGQSIDTLLRDARGYVEHSVPDALQQFGIDATTSVGKATLDRLLTPQVPVAVGKIMPNGDRLMGRAS